MVPRMQIRFPILAAPLALAALAACGPADNEAGPGDVSVGEAKALDEAAEMIEQRRLPEEALPKTTGDNPPLPPQGETQSAAE